MFWYRQSMIAHDSEQEHFNLSKPFGPLNKSDNKLSMPAILKLGHTEQSCVSLHLYIDIYVYAYTIEVLCPRELPSVNCIPILD